MFEGQLSLKVHKHHQLKHLRHRRSPNRQRLPPSLHGRNRRLAIHQIPIRIMLDNKPTPITQEPIVKNLTAQYMPPHAPAKLITLPSQPIMAQLLHIEIMDLECRMRDIDILSWFRRLEEE